MSYLGRSAKLSRKTQEKVSFLATAGQTNKAGLSYVPTFVEVTVNGILLTDVTDYTATSGSSITFTVALGLNDEVTVVSLKTFALANHYNRAEADAAFEPIDSAYTKAEGDARYEPIDSAYTKAEADANLAAMVDSAPAALNTLNELAAALGDDVNFSTTVNNSIATKLPKSGGTMTGDTLHGDNVKAKFGTGNDLTIHHDGSNSYIIDNGTGDLIVLGNNVQLRNTAFEYYLTCNTDEGVTAYYNNVAKLATTATGVDISGTVTADGLDVRASAVGEASVAKISNEYTGGLAVASMEFGSGGAAVKASIAAAVYNDGYMVFRTNNNTEKMRITAAGDLLVGKSAIGLANEGFEAQATGQTITTQAAAIVAKFNRLTSDGDINTFYKDGTAVGSIGTTAGELTAGSAATGIRFTNAATRIDPWNTSSNVASDGIIDFGTGGRRFKDAYLSGGIHLGGTGAANKLDDYEEGSWNPLVRAASGTEPTVGESNSGYYTKIGRAVHLSGEINISALSGTTTGILAIRGLPFTILSVGGGNSVGSIAPNGLNFTRPSNKGFNVYSANTLAFLSSNNNGGWGWELVNILSVGDSFRFSITIHTT